MTTKEYKDKFKGIRKAWLSTTLDELINSDKYNLVVEYLRGTKDIGEVENIEDLYSIRNTFFQLKVSCKMILENIEKLDLSFIGEFDDKQMDLSDIGIDISDEFKCINDFTYRGMILIKKDTIINIISFKYAGAKSLLEGRFVNLITDQSTERHFPEQNDIKLLFSFDELETHFIKSNNF